MRKMEQKNRILIVEDDTDINNLLYTALQKAGYETVQAFSGTEARMLFQMDKAGFSLILLDLMLPGISGEEVLAQIRKQGNTPVIVLTAGEIEMFGCKGKELERIRSRVGCLIEAPGLYGNMNAYTNLKIKCELFGIRKKGYIEDILETVGLEGVGKKKTKHFSLGMKQRLGIGLALVGEPDLLVLDEPINGLDPQGIAEVRDTIQRLRDERNMTILISSHILEELSKIATDYGIIHNGSLLQELTSEELMKRCSERIEIELIHPEQAVPILDRMGFTNYQVTDKSHIHIFERLNESANVNMELAKAGILVNGISITSEELETYFLNLTGGNQNA